MAIGGNGRRAITGIVGLGVRSIAILSTATRDLATQVPGDGKVDSRLVTASGSVGATTVKEELLQ